MAQLVSQRTELDLVAIPSQVNRSTRSVRAQPHPSDCRRILGFLIPLLAMPKQSRLAHRSESNHFFGDGDRRSVLLALLNLIRTEVDLDKLLRRVVDLLAQAMDADRATLFLVDPQSGELVSKAAHLPELPEIRLRSGQGIAGLVAQTQRPVNQTHADDHPRFAASIDRLTGYKTVTVLAVPVLGDQTTHGRKLLGVIEVLNKKRGSFDEDDCELLCELADEVATALHQTQLPERVTMKTPERYHRIIGTSTAMQRVYEIIGRAAATTATVLIRGESGTGKELAARAIHVNSQRAHGPFVKIDCTSIPEGLMESELFGHERGAFTGAEQRVLGKAELADGGTLFLDEIGDLKGSLQGKLLRLLQDREFERVGGRKTLSVDVRIVAATNRPLEAWVDSGQFRADLYYRLKVIELAMPSLRERGPDDIERLGQHFVKLYSQKHNKLIRGLSTDALLRLRSHPWPGNIRELEHCIESAVALCPGLDITSSDLPLPSSLSGSLRGSQQDGKPTDSFAPKGHDPALPKGLELPEGLSLADVEQRYIRHTLDRFAGNRSEAARALGIGRNTLLRKLKEE